VAANTSERALPLEDAPEWPAGTGPETISATLGYHTVSPACAAVTARREPVAACSWPDCPAHRNGCSGMAGAFGLKRENYRTASAPVGADLALRHPSIQLGTTNARPVRSKWNRARPNQTIIREASWRCLRADARTGNTLTTRRGTDCHLTHDRPRENIRSPARAGVLRDYTCGADLSEAPVGQLRSAARPNSTETGPPSAARAVAIDEQFAAEEASFRRRETWNAFPR